MASFVSHLECSYDGSRYPARSLQTVSALGKPLLVRYDLDALRGAVSKERVSTRPGGLWRFHEFLPVEHPHNRLDLREVVTPLLQLRAAGTGELWVKDESRLPTGSFKARGLSVAVSMAKEL